MEVLSSIRTPDRIYRAEAAHPHPQIQRSIAGNESKGVNDDLSNDLC